MGKYPMVMGSLHNEYDWVYSGALLVDGKPEYYKFDIKEFGFPHETLEEIFNRYKTEGNSKESQ